MSRIALVLLLLPVFACASARDTEGVRSAMSAFMDALNDLDADRIASHFADDASAFFPTVKAGRVDGHEAIAEVFRNVAHRALARLEQVALSLSRAETRDLRWHRRNPTFRIGA